MKTILVLIILLCCYPVFADSNDYRIEYVCSNSESDFYELEAYADGAWVFVPQGEVGETDYLDNPNGIARLSFPRPSVGVLVYFGMMPLGITYAGNIDCETVQDEFDLAAFMRETLPITIPLFEGGINAVHKSHYLCR